MDKDKFNPTYSRLHFWVIPLTLRGYVEGTYIDDLPEVDRAIQWRLDKVKRLGDESPIPSKFHQVKGDIEKGAFCYELHLTYSKVVEEEFSVEAQVDGVISIVTEIERPCSIRVCWALFSPQPLSVNQLESVIKQYGEIYHPLDFTTLLRQELVGAWKGEGT